MAEVFVLLIISTILAYQVRNNSYEIDQKGLRIHKCSSTGALLFFALGAYLVWFAGLRTFMNDTASYIRSFANHDTGLISGLRDIEWSIGANPLFHVYQVLLKNIISSSGHVLIFVTSTIVVVSMIRFLHKYSTDFGLSMLIFIAFTVYAFTMAAMKQTLATAIGIWSVPEIVRGRRLKAILILAIAVFVHPYVVLFSIAFLLVYRGTWNKTVLRLLLISIVICLFFASTMGGILVVTEYIGDAYQIDTLTQESGVNILRIFFYLIVPVMSFLSREELREINNPFYDLCINLSIIAMCLSIISGFGGATLLGRLPNYFDIFICLSIPYILQNGRSKIVQSRKMVTAILVAGYLVFYFTYYKKYIPVFGNSYFTSFYSRISIGDLIRSW